MLLRTFANDVQIVPILAALAASADEDRASEILDCADVGRVQILFFSHDQAHGTTNSVSLQHDDELDAHGDMYGPIAVKNATTAIADDDDGNVFGCEFVPTRRYYQLLVDKDAHGDTNESAIALVYRKERPVTQADGATLGTGDVTIISLGDAADAE